MEQVSKPKMIKGKDWQDLSVFKSCQSFAQLDVRTLSSYTKDTY
jgi:hypothetical protein